MNQNKIYRAAIYVRLSKEDGDISSAEKAESNSIANQKELIRSFLKDKQDIEVVSERVDDGYSGVSFERPAFQLMLEDIKKGKVDCVVVKDLSRFGRNYIESGRYIEKIFPMLGVRFIAINDSYDSLDGKSQTDEIIIPFKNLINDAYCRDISVKIRSHLDIKRKKGEFIASFAVYGYKKDCDNHNRLAVDEYAAGVVRDIFSWKIAGMSQQAIADRLNNRGILSPAEYKKSCGSRYRAKFQKKEKALWSAVAVTRILKNEVYLGNLVQGKVTTPNYKVKKTVQKEKSDWVKIEDTHEAVIEAGDFAIVQELLQRDMRTSPGRKEVYLFSGILFCGDCHNVMTRKTSVVSGKKYAYYMCSENKRGGECSSHRISEKELEKAIMGLLKLHIEKLQDMEKEISMMENLPEKEYNIRLIETRIIKQKEEIDRNDRLKLSLYEDLKEGILTKEEYLALKKEFEQRKRDAYQAARQAETEKKRLMEQQGKHHEWIDEFLQYREMKSLNRTVLVELVKRIEVYEDKRISVCFRYTEEYQELCGLLLEQQEKPLSRRKEVV